MEFRVVSPSLLERVRYCIRPRVVKLRRESRPCEQCSNKHYSCQGKGEPTRSPGRANDRIAPDIVSDPPSLLMLKSSVENEAQTSRADDLNPRQMNSG